MESVWSDDITFISSHICFPRIFRIWPLVELSFKVSIAIRLRFLRAMAFPIRFHHGVSKYGFLVTNLNLLLTKLIDSLNTTVGYISIN